MTQNAPSDDTVREWTPKGHIHDNLDDRIRGFQDGIPHMAWTVRIDGSIEYVNRRWKEYTGLSSEEMADWKWAEVIHPEDKQVFMDHWHKAMKSGEHFEDELRLRRFDNVYRWHSLKDWPAREEDGTIIRWFGTATDIDDARQLAKKLQASNNELDQFASMAAHDLQEPLRMAGSFVALLQRKYADQLDDRAKEYISRAIDGNNRMRILITELLEFSRLGHDAAPVQEVDSIEVLVEVETNLKNSIDNLSFDISHGLLPVLRMNRSHLVSLLQNLIGNGLKYHRPNIPPVIYLEAERIAHEWVFSIRDNGIGIKEADRLKIFDVFTRLHTRTEFAGTGIGLAICKKIVDVYQGRIWTEPSEGEGSTFKFTIPDQAGTMNSQVAEARAM